MIDVIIIVIFIVYNIRKFFKQTVKEFSSLNLNTRKVDSLRDIVDKIDYANNFNSKFDNISIIITQSFIITFFISFYVFNHFDKKRVIALFFLNFIILTAFNNFTKHHMINRVHHFADKNIKKLRKQLNIKERYIPIGRKTMRSVCDYYTYMY